MAAALESLNASVGTAGITKLLLLWSELQL